MAWWKHFFKKRKNKNSESPEEEWEGIVYARDDVDFHDEEQRSRYIVNCMEQISEASREIDLLTGEYSVVTSYLTDMEEIEALPPAQRAQLDRTAAQMEALEQECTSYRSKKERMSDADFYRMRKQENEVEEGIVKLRETEEYGTKVKSDLHRLDSERHAYEYRRSELVGMMNANREIVIVVFTALLFCEALLLFLRFGLHMENLVAPLAVVTAFVATLVIVLNCVRYTQEDKELSRVERAIGKLVLLQNKVKIRYVNNTQLMQYLLMKYDTESADALAKLWTKYLDEKEERSQFAEAEGKLEQLQKKLIDTLSGYRVRTPSRWITQTRALLDKREMVELRHDLILRRQALREQLDYNQKVAWAAQTEIKDIAREYPQYAQEILAMVDRYDQP